jgi:hypothetical protein
MSTWKEAADQLASKDACISELECDISSLLRRVKTLEGALRQIINECCENIDCTHQDADDGSDDCTDIDDCVGCFIVMIADAALAPPEEADRG